MTDSNALPDSVLSASLDRSVSAEQFRLPSASAGNALLSNSAGMNLGQSSDSFDLFSEGRGDESLGSKHGSQTESQQEKLKKRKRTNYRSPEHAAKLTQALEVMLKQKNEKEPKDLKTVANMFDIPYNTLRDNYMRATIGTTFLNKRKKNVEGSEAASEGGLQSMGIAASDSVKSLASAATVPTNKVLPMNLPPKSESSSQLSGEAYNSNGGGFSTHPLPESSKSNMGSSMFAYDQTSQIWHLSNLQQQPQQQSQPQPQQQPQQQQQPVQSTYNQAPYQYTSSFNNDDFNLAELMAANPLKDDQPCSVNVAQLYQQQPQSQSHSQMQPLPAQVPQQQQQLQQQQLLQNQQSYPLMQQSQQLTQFQPQQFQQQFPQQQQLFPNYGGYYDAPMLTVGGVPAVTGNQMYNSVDNSSSSVLPLNYMFQQPSSTISNMTGSSSSGGSITSGTVTNSNGLITNSFSSGNTGLSINRNNSTISTNMNGQNYMVGSAQHDRLAGANIDSNNNGAQQAMGGKYSAWFYPPGTMPPTTVDPAGNDAGAAGSAPAIAVPLVQQLQPQQMQQQSNNLPVAGASGWFYPPGTMPGSGNFATIPLSDTGSSSNGSSSSKHNGNGASMQLIAPRGNSSDSNDLESDPDAFSLIPIQDFTSATSAAAATGAGTISSDAVVQKITDLAHLRDNFSFHHDRK